MNDPLQSTAELAIDWRAPARLRSARAQTDVLTLLLAVAVFTGYGLVTWFFRDLPLWVAAPLGALCLAWYGSFQHETIHNHPTPSRRLNRVLGSAPLALWLPYHLYRTSHLQHHRHGGRHLTDADADPESFFLAPGSHARHGRVRRLLDRANCTLAGRLLVGPALSLARFWSAEARRLLAGDRRRQILWLRHAMSVALVIFWVTQVCCIPWLVYVTLVVYPSIALTHLRSFAEHRVDAHVQRRTVTVETNRLWSLLFLNNNLHVAHHAHPDVPWHQLPAAWRQMRRDALDRGLVFENGYASVARRYLLQPVIGVEHPGFDGARPDSR